MPIVLARLHPFVLVTMLALASCSTTGGAKPSDERPEQDAPTEPAEATPSAARTEPTVDPGVQPKPEGAAGSPELSKTSLLEVEGFTGTDASILGLKLGLGWDEAKAIVDANPELVFDLDEPNPGRFYVNDAGGEPGDPALFYCQWPDGRETMGRMVIYGRAKRFMPASAAPLFDMPSLAEAPAAVRAWLGEPDRSVVTLDIPSIGLKLTTHVFERRALEVIDYSSSGEPPHVMIAVVVPELLETGAKE